LPGSLKQPTSGTDPITGQCRFFSADGRQRAWPRFAPARRLAPHRRTA